MNKIDVNGDLSKINLRTDEINEILGVPPLWLIRWGTYIIFIIICIIFIGSFFFYYPDTIFASVVLTSDNPPSVIIARATGRCDAIFKPDGSMVSKSDTLAVIENAARYSDVLLLSTILKRYNLFVENDSINRIIFSNNLILGDLQSTFNSFSTVSIDYGIFLKQKLHDQKIKALEEELLQSKIYYDRLLTQQNLASKDLKLTAKQFSRDSLLFCTNIIAATEYEKSEAAYISKIQILENTKINLSNASISIGKLKQNIADTRLEHESEKKKLEEELQNWFNQLKSGLASWEKNYLLIAPSSGKLTYITVWSRLQEIKVGDKVFTIDPIDRGEIQARLTIPFAGAGKVKVGQRVIIKLDPYPYLEFGVIEGVVKSISDGYTDNGFPVVVSLPFGAISTYKFPIKIERDLTGTAEITTENLTLIQRLINPVKYLNKKGFKFNKENN